MIYVSVFLCSINQPSENKSYGKKKKHFIENETAGRRRRFSLFSHLFYTYQKDIFLSFSFCLFVCFLSFFLSLSFSLLLPKNLSNLSFLSPSVGSCLSLFFLIEHQLHVCTYTYRYSLDMIEKKTLDQ